MYRPEFLAVVHAKGGDASAASIAARFNPSSISTIPLAEGGLLLCRWDGAIIPARGAIAVVDGTHGAPAPAVPRAMIDTDVAPDGLLDAARQYRSYLWLDAGGRLTCWSDHLGVSRIYHARIGECEVLCDDPALLAGSGPALDPAMVSSFLVNGYMVRGHTLFTGVTGLPNASLARITPDGCVTTPYWRFQPGADLWRDKRALGRELWSRITSSVLSSVTGGHTVIALSGGYDSATMLGILAGAGQPVSSFSFALGEPLPGSDAEVARRQAMLLGVEHRIYRYDGDFSIKAMLEMHLDSGLIMRKGCYEISAYNRAISDALARWDNPVMCFGDEAFGQGAFRIRSDDDLLGSAALKSPDIMAPLVPPIQPGPAAALGAALRESYGDLLGAARRETNREDTRDRLFLEIFLIGNMVQMRRQTVGRRMGFAMPYLEMGVLDMARHLPSPLRTHKNFFEAVARRELPELFRIRRAAFSQAQPVLRDAITDQQLALRDAINGLRHGIPDVMSPADLMSVLETICARPNAPVPPYRTAIGSAVRKLLRRQFIPLPLEFAMKRLYWTKFHRGTDQAGLFMRALHLSMTVDRLTD